MAEVERQFGPVDLLVNNAAVLTPLGQDWEVDVDEWWRTLEINVKGPFLCTQLVLPGMLGRRRGRIINVSSVAAHGVFPFGSAYCASKAALSHMTNLLAAAVKEHGITVFALSPAGATAMGEILATSAVVPERIRADRRAMEANPRVDIDSSVRMLMFLASGQADGLTGRHINHWSDIDDLLRRSEDIVKNDLYTLRLRE
jgi:NAD(P)-dependent dehydrogenase (short-subunit alcohol dehydrogenase family)